MFTINEYLILGYDNIFYIYNLNISYIYLKRYILDDVIIDPINFKYNDKFLAFNSENVTFIIKLKELYTFKDNNIGFDNLSLNNNSDNDFYISNGNNLLNQNEFLKNQIDTNNINIEKKNQIVNSEKKIINKFKDLKWSLENSYLDKLGILDNIQNEKEIKRKDLIDSISKIKIKKKIIKKKNNDKLDIKKQLFEDLQYLEQQLYNSNIEYNNLLDLS